MDIDTGTNELLCTVKDGVATITLNRPEARNAMAPALTAALRQQIKQRGEDDTVGALLITGAGTAFCSGGDVNGMGGRGPRGQMSFDERLADLRWRQAGLTGALVTTSARRIKFAMASGCPWQDDFRQAYALLTAAAR